MGLLLVGNLGLKLNVCGVTPSNKLIYFVYYVICLKGWNENYVQVDKWILELDYCNYLNIFRNISQ